MKGGELKRGRAAEHSPWGLEDDQGSPLAPMRLPRGLNAPLGRPVEEVKEPVIKAVGELRLEEEEEVMEEKPVESTEEAVEEVEGPGSSRVDPLGGIPIEAVEKLHATLGAGQTRRRLRG